MSELFKIRSFVFLWLGQASSGLGGSFGAFILSWLAYELTGSLTLMASVFAVEMGVDLLSQLISGPYLDRWSKRKVMVASEWIRAGAFFLLTILLFLNELQVYHLFFTAICIGIAEPLFRPSSMYIVADVLPGNRLNKGNSMLEGTMQAMFLIGPLLAGLLLEGFGPSYVLMSLTIILGVSGLLLLFLPEIQKDRTVLKNSWFKQFNQGVKFFKINKVFLGLGLLLLILNFTIASLTPMFLPYVTTVLNGTSFEYGLFTSALSFGMVGGSVLTGYSREPKNRRFIMLTTYLGIGILVLMLGFITYFPLNIIFITLVGGCIILFSVNNMTLYQKYVPKALMGRVFAARILIAKAGMPFGALVGGKLSEEWGILTMFKSLGFLILITVTIAYSLRVFKQLDDEDKLRKTLVSMTYEENNNKIASL